MHRASLTRLAMLIAGSVLLVACDPGEDGTGRIEDLPPEARTIMGEDGAFNGTVSEYLALLDFAPLYPSEAPKDLELVAARVTPSVFARNGSNELATLWLDYRGDTEDDWATVSQQTISMPTINGAETTAVEVGDVDGLLVDLPRTEALQLVWHMCDVTISIMSPALAEDELIEMGSSMECRLADADD